MRQISLFHGSFLCDKDLDEIPYSIKTFLVDFILEFIYTVNKFFKILL